MRAFILAVNVAAAVILAALTAIGPYEILPRIFFGLAACSVAVNAARGFAKLWGAVNDGGTANPS
jgi:hypothetical protein